MELVLNLVWVLVAAAALAGWSLAQRCERETRGGVGRQLVTLGFLLLVLFPAISITDDLWAAHNPAETDVLVRRHDDAWHAPWTLPHSPAPFLAGSFQPPRMAFLGYAAVPVQAVPSSRRMAGSRLFIRPPPVL